MDCALEVTDGYPIVLLLVAGRPARFVVDTGADVTVVTPDLATALDLPVVGEHSSGVAGDRRITVRLTRLSEIELCGAAASLEPVAIVDFSVLPPPVGTVDGILGGDFIAAHPLTLDYPSRRLTIESAESLAKRRAAGTTVPLRLRGGRTPFATVAVDGRAVGGYKLDTGAARCFVPHAQFRASGVDVDSLPRATRQGLGGEYSTTALSVGRFEVGGVAVEDLDVFGHDSDLGLIGSGFLSQFVVTLDYPSGEMVLRGAERAPSITPDRATATSRFSSRVADYERFRPGYPPEVVERVRDTLGLAPEHVVADLGSGTGLLTRCFLANGNAAYGVEPNNEMRAAGERQLAGFERFTSVAGRAEATGLPDDSVDLIVAGQAFHWFDPGAARAECLRILRPGRGVALVWNERRLDTSPLLRAYEALLVEFAASYPCASVGHALHDDFATFFGCVPDEARFPNRQVLDFEGLSGRLLSSSYAPAAGDPAHEPMMSALRELFDAHQADGRVVLEYDTVVFTARLT